MLNSPLKYVRLEHYGPECLIITFKSSYLHSQLIYEMESICSYLSKNPSLETVLLTSEKNQFSLGVDPHEMELMNNAEWMDYVIHLRKLILVFLHLPQIIILDLCKGANDEGLEMAFSCDLRVAHRESKFQLNHLKQGKILSGASIRMLHHLAPLSIIQKWIFHSNEILISEMTSFGLIHQIYSQDTREQTLQNIIQHLNSLPIIQRIQMKKLLVDPMIKEILIEWKNETELIKASIDTNDWKEFVLSIHEQRQAKFASVEDRF